MFSPLGDLPDDEARLAEQHLLWRGCLLDALDRLGVGEGLSVLDVGCGGGRLLADLAYRVGPMGRVHGVERDPSLAKQAEASLSGVPWASVEAADLLTAPLGAGWDAIICRFVLSVLPDPAQAVRRLLAALRPGGVLVVQEALHDSLNVFPPNEVIRAAMETSAGLAAERGVDLRAAGHLPATLVSAGLELIEIEPKVHAGRPGSLAWRWCERTLLGQIPALRAAGALDADGEAALRESWAALVDRPGALVMTPTAVVIAGRRPKA
ncbi:methyltransferase domain-containing protein [Myxococcota bacterium]|nr:methyltransferase domain-containing protein [Myxococcota bacterium]